MRVHFRRDDALRAALPEQRLAGAGQRAGSWRRAQHTAVRGWQQAAHQCAEGDQHAQHLGLRQDGQQQPLQPAHFRRLLFQHLAPDLRQLAVAHTGRAGGFASAAGEAAVEVLARACARLAALQHSLDEIDAPARPVQLVAAHLVGGAGGVAEPAVDAAAQNLVRPLAMRGGQNGRRDLGVHGLGTRDAVQAGIEDAVRVESA